MKKKEKTQSSSLSFPFLKLISITPKILGHIISADGIQVDKAKIELITNLPIPKTFKDVRSFLGHISFDSRFIKVNGHRLKPFISNFEPEFESIPLDDPINAAY